MEFLHTFLWLHFAGKPVVALQNVSCILTQTDCLESTLHHVRNIGWVWDSLKIPTNYSPLLWLITSNDTVWFIKKETGAKPGFSKWGATETTHQIVMSTSMVYTAVLPCVSVGSVVLSRHECPLLSKDKSRYRKYFTKNQILKKWAFQQWLFIYGQDIVMAFSPPEYCRLFAQKKAYQGGYS